MRARVGSPWFVPKLETRTSSAMPVTLRAVGTQVLRGCVWFVASLLLRCRGRFFRLLRALPHEAGFFFPYRIDLTTTYVPRVLVMPMRLGRTFNRRKDNELRGKSKTPPQYQSRLGLNPT